MPRLPRRRRWFVDHLDIRDEPMILSLLKYRQIQDRRLSREKANVVSSHIAGSKLHAPIIDLDFPHRYIPSSTEGHGHLYIDVPMTRWRMFWLLRALYKAGVIEKGHYLWSLRRGGTFVRLPEVSKTPEEAAFVYTYGMFRKLKEYR